MNAPKPFELEYSPQFAELLHNLKISLAISTYQAGKVVLVSPINTDRLIQLPRTFENAMGMATTENKIAVATQGKVEVLKSSSKLAKIYPTKKGVYDDIFLPRMTYHTGYLALHDMAFVKNKIVAVNTLFSNLSYIDENQSFTPFWQPLFISELEPEDRCHLNGMAIENDEVKYLTALGSTNTAHGWRENKIKGGILLEYPSGKIILDGLSMPHSPRIYDGKLYVLNSAQGELIEVNPERGTYEVIVNLGGFARGMDRVGEYLFIGVSKLRHNSDVFSDLPITKTSFAGIIAVHLPYKTVVAKAEYKMSVEEIYDVKILPNMLRPNIISTDMDIKKGAIEFNGKTFWGEIKSEKTQKVTDNQNKTEIKIQVLKGISPSDLMSKFDNLICLDLKSNIKSGKISNKLNMVVASAGANPIGLVVFEAKNDKTAKINSIFVKSEFRNKKLATGLLQHTQKLLEQNKIKYIEVIFTEKNIDLEIVNKLFNKVESINLVINKKNV